jgi:hypothetical protein
MLVVIALMVAVSCNNEEAVSIQYEMLGYHPGTRDALGTYFVVAKVSGISNQDARHDLQIIARKLCKQKDVCFAHFWSAKEGAARSLPMSDQEVDAMIASYNINRYTRNDDFQCHNFGSAGQRCS